MQLIEINPRDVNRVFSSFYHPDSQFWMINHGDVEVAIYGVKTITAEVCEISLCIFETYRYKVPYKTGLRLLLSYPFTLGFSKILIATQEKSIITLLRQCHILGVRFLKHDHGKVWFVVERSEDL